MCGVFASGQSMVLQVFSCSTLPFQNSNSTYENNVERDLIGPSDLDALLCPFILSVVAMDWQPREKWRSAKLAHR